MKKAFLPLAAFLILGSVTFAQVSPKSKTQTTTSVTPVAKKTTATTAVTKTENTKKTAPAATKAPAKSPAIRKKHHKAGKKKK